MRTRRGQRGLSSVEFSIVALTMFMVVFAVFEVGRLYFVMNALEEAARRGVRVAAVCPLFDPAIAEVAVFAPDGGTASDIVYGLGTGNVTVEYLNELGTAMADPSGDYPDIAYVRVRVSNLSHQLLIPLFQTTFTLPEVQSTIPRESLGVTPTGFTTC